MGFRVRVRARVRDRVRGRGRGRGRVGGTHDDDGLEVGRVLVGPATDPCITWSTPGS